MTRFCKPTGEPRPIPPRTPAAFTPPEDLVSPDDPQRCRQAAGRCERREHDGPRHYTTYTNGENVWDHRVEAEAAPLDVERVSRVLFDVFPEDHDTNGLIFEALARLSEGAAPRAEGLQPDTPASQFADRLAEALDKEWDAFLIEGEPSLNFGDYAERVAVRLSRPSDERVPHE